MSALAEALVAAQRRAVAVLEKAYVAGAFEDDRMRASRRSSHAGSAAERGRSQVVKSGR